MNLLHRWRNSYLKRRHRGMIPLHPPKHKKINRSVLISYVREPYVNNNEMSLCRHTRFAEMVAIVNSFLDRGYYVDVIDFTNEDFVPTKNYDFFIDIQKNMARLNHLVGDNCIKIAHLTGAHWLFQNHAELKRLLDLQERRGISLVPQRTVDCCPVIDLADRITLIGNDFTMGTFSYTKKIITPLCISAVATYPWNENKNFDVASKKFVWFGSKGLVHKGLDLVLEAFKKMPEYTLYVCGDLSAEEDFVVAYHEELYNTPNIKVVGWLDLTSLDFLEMAQQCVTLIYPSCSEGTAGCVVSCMHAGIIPAVTRESGVDIGDFGYLIDDISIDGICSLVEKIALTSPFELSERSRATHKYAQEHHTKENFKKLYGNFIDELAYAI